MHDVVRDVAIKIASNKEHNMLLGSSEIRPKRKKLRKCTALTFPYGIVPDFPECLISPSIKFLLLYHNDSSPIIEDNLFEKMQKLKVLDIRSVDLFPKLPSSLAFLKNLHSLSMDFCKLGDIKIVGKLKKLKVLSLNTTSIRELPMEMGDLAELRILDLNGCSELKVIPPGIIKRLSRLEELHMARSFSKWEVEGVASSERKNANLDELKCLVDLTTLRIHIPDAKLLPRYFSFEKLERFTILVGDANWKWSCHDEQSLCRFNAIKIKVNGSRYIHLEAVVKEKLKRTRILYLDGMKNIHELEWESFKELKFVHIQHSAGTPCIVNEKESFPVGLESLFLSHLSQLQTLYKGKFTAESSFSNLKYVDVNNCNGLRNLFSFSMARGLPHLEEVKVTDCASLEAIVGDTSEDGKYSDIMMDKLEFRRLRSLILTRLPKLARFCNSEKVLFPNIEELKLEGCDNMEYLFDQSVFMGLEQLNFVRIVNCKSLKRIVKSVSKEAIKFPQLVTLILKELPCLTRFYSGCSIVFPTLTRLWIRECRQLKTFVWPDTIREDRTMTNKEQPLFNEKVGLPNLKQLYIWGMNNVETIWHYRLYEDSFSKLELVDIRSCPKLLKIFPCTIFGRIQGLEKLRVRSNCSIEQVFENDQMKKANISRGEITEHKIKFPQLKFLQLVNLRNLKQFCSESCVVFPALTQLQIQNCEKIETFVDPIGVSNSKRKGVEDMDSNDLQPLFNEKVQFPSLKKLQLTELNNIKIIWESRIHEDSFSRLEELTIWKCAKLLIIFPLAMLGRIQSLKKLWIRDSCSVEQIFEAPTNTSEWLHRNGIIDVMVSDLWLDSLPELKCLWREDLVRILSFCNLRNVKVGRLHQCQSLKSLKVRDGLDLASILQGLASFEFLTVLQISKCDGLVNLVQFSTAKSLAHLTTLKVTGCQTLKEIMASESGDGAENKVVFHELKTLDLVELPSLVNFCPDNCTLEFPLLEEVKVKDCNNMKAFCGGITITPKLKTLSLTREKMEFKGDEEDKDLNTITKFQEAHGLTTEHADATTSLETLFEAEYICHNGPQAPTPDVTCSSSQSHHALDSTIGATTCQQNNDFPVLEVTSHLVPLLEKARDKHGDFHNSPSIKSKAVRITAMESVGQVLEVLQAQTPRTIDAEKIQFMEDAFHDLSFMNFPIEWLHSMIDEAKKWLQRKAKIEKMEAQVQALKRELEMEKALDQPLLDI